MNCTFLDFSLQQQSCSIFRKTICLASPERYQRTHSCVRVHTIKSDEKNQTFGNQHFYPREIFPSEDYFLHLTQNYYICSLQYCDLYIFNNLLIIQIMMIKYRKKIIVCCLYHFFERKRNFGFFNSEKTPKLTHECYFAAWG